MNRIALALIVLLVPLLSACASRSGAEGSQGDEIVVGGFLGNAFRDDSIGQGEADSALADLLKTRPGSTLTDKDRQAAAMALGRALELRSPGGTIAWQNKSSGVSGNVIAGPVYQVNDVICRDYTHVLRLEKSEEKVRGSACREQNGTWRPIV